MKSFAALIPALGFVAGVHAWSNETIYTTLTVQTLTTYCPEATTFTHGTKTYTATAHETLTITDCPCTIKHPVKPTHTPLPPKPTTHQPTIETRPPVSVTITVSEYTTYCPYPTTIPIGPNSTITVTQETTLTVSQCPCTLTKPAVVTTTISYITTYCPEPTTLTVGTSTHTVPAGTVTIPVEHPTTVPAPEPTKPGNDIPPPVVTKTVETQQTPPAVSTKESETAPPPAVTKTIETQQPPAISTQESEIVPPPTVTKTVETQSTTAPVPTKESEHAPPPVSTKTVEVIPAPSQSVPVESPSAPPSGSAGESTLATIPATIPVSSVSSQVATTSAPTFHPTGTGAFPSSTTGSLFSANNAVRHHAGFGAFVFAGLAAVLL